MELQKEVQVRVNLLSGLLGDVGVLIEDAKEIEEQEPGLLAEMFTLAERQAVLAIKARIVARIEQEKNREVA